MASKFKRIKLERFFLVANNDVIEMIMKLLPVKDIASLARTCSKMREISLRESLWASILQRDFHVKKDSIFDIDKSSREVYQEERTICLSTFNLDKISGLLYMGNGPFFEVVKCNLRRELDLNATNIHGLTLLMYASYFGHKNIVDILLKKKVDVNVRMDYCAGALSAAVCKNGIDIVKRLVKHGADLELTNGLGETALTLACGFGHVKIAKYLLKKGARANFRDNAGRTPLDWAVMNSQFEIINLLNNE